MSSVSTYQARDEWGGAIFPMVAGHEIVGRVARVGEHLRELVIAHLRGLARMPQRIFGFFQHQNLRYAAA